MKTIEVGETFFLTKTEEVWDKPFVMKRHHTYDTRSVVLEVLVTDIKGDEFKALILNNNGFEKMGQEFVFHKNSLLGDQDFKQTELLGKWI